jgi:hypothetical protein
MPHIGAAQRSGSPGIGGLSWIVTNREQDTDAPIRVDP